ncbi:MAG TPA: SPOR domain-containing protein, partial [Desulfatiglandales bacterium]|nr:SPOR domain-containing protein [Desulfatiglandales bacterium]
PVKAAAPKQVQKGPALTEPVKKVESRIVPPKVMPAKEAVPQSPAVKSERSFEPDTYLSERPYRDEGSVKKAIEKMEIHERPKKKLSPFIIVSSIIVLVILALLTGMVIEDRGGIIGGIRTKRDSGTEKEAPARTDKDKDAKASAVIDKKSEIKEPDIQASQQLKEEIPPAIDEAASTVPAQVTDKVIASEGPKTLSYPYSIYLGSYDRLESVKDLEIKYEAMGLSPYWVKADLGERGVWFRLFTNFFQTREEADNFIKTRQVPDAETQKTKYVNLIGMYSSAQEAAKQREIIKEMGYCPYIINDNKNIFWLYVGAFNEKDLAERHNAELLQKGIQSEVVER